MTDWREHVAIDPSVQGGAPVVAGTRVPISVLVDAVAAGDPLDEVAAAYRVTVTQVRAALAYAAELVGSSRRRQAFEAARSSMCTMQ